jgi:energy-converting hydrogenase Eha subunit A
MQSCFWRRILVSIAVFFLAGSIWVMHSPPALAYDNPDLLPKTFTPVVDLAKSLPKLQEEKLVKDLEQFETDTGWKLRVLTQYDRTPGRAVIVGDAVYELLPRTFWIELQTRFGNLYFVREQGEDQAILQALESVKGCLLKGGCNVVPGLPREQWILTLITSVIGGIICGFAAQPRDKGQVFAWQWALIFSPLWGILFIAFGIGPVVTRTSDWLPLVRNISGFLIGVLVAYLSPVFSRPSSSNEL